jgi:hypothetical protein
MMNHPHNRTTGDRDRRHASVPTAMVVILAALSLALPLGSLGAEAPSTPTPKVRKSPADIAEEFVRLVHLDRAPWQFYLHYSKVFQQLGQQALRGPSKDRATLARRRKVAKQYFTLSKMVNEMGRMAKLRRDIMDNKVDIPLAKRQEKFVEAGRRHDELMAQFKQITGAGKSIPPPRLTARSKKTNGRK